MNQTIGVNIVPQSPQPTLHYSQGDVGRVFVVNVTDYDIPAGATVTCVATKPSGMGFTVSGTVSGNSVTFTSTAEMTDEWGRFPAEIRIASGDTLLGTANFLMIGEKDPHPASTIDGTQEELIPQLTLLVNRVEAAAESVHDLTVSATTLAAGSNATATYDSANNSIAFGIPRGADGDVTRAEFNDLKSELGQSHFYQNKKARGMTITVPCSIGDAFFFKALKWSGDSWTQIAVQGLYSGSYTTVLRASALNQELTFTADKAYESFLVSINVASVPSVNTEFEFLLCNLNTLTNISSYVFNNRINSFQSRGYLGATANVNNVTKDGWYLIAASRISTMSGLPSDLSTDAVLQVYSGSLTLQTITELSTPYRQYQRYLYSSNTQQSVWICTRPYIRKKTAYLFGDSLTKGVLGTGGNGISYLEISAKKAGYDVVNCGVGGIGYVYSAKKLVSEVPWNTGEGRIRAQDVINHYASDLVNADTVILAYGVNDWQALGDTNVTIAEADRRATSANIIANVKTAIETIMTAHIAVRIIVVTPINTSYRGGSIASGWGLETSLNNNNDGREAMTLEKTYQAIVDACNYYGVKYIDMTHNNAEVNYLNINDVLADHLHPTQTTYYRLADSIQI